MKLFTPQVKQWIKYIIVGSIKTTLTMLFLWLVIDVWQFEPRWLGRSIVIGSIFILGYYLYKWFGFSR